MDPLPNLFTFVQAAELGSFTAAARAIGITQAAVSQRMQQLESVVGVRLFRRGSGRMALTNAGRKLHEYGKRIIELQAEARVAVANVKSELVGNLFIAASSIPGSHLLPSICEAFRRTHPQVNLRVRISDSEDVARLVDAEKVEVGFAGDRLEFPNLVYDRLTGDELALVMPSNHHFAERRRISMREFVRAPLIQRENGSGSRRCLERALARIGQDPKALRIVLEVDGNEAIRDSVLRGQGLAVLSRKTVQHDILKGTMRAVPITGLNLSRDLFVVRNRRRLLSAAAQSFLAFFRS